MSTETKSTPSGKMLPGNVTQEQAKKWKEEHGEVHVITVNKDDAGKEVATGYFKKPDRKTLAAAMKFATSDPVKMNEIIMTNCWLGGDSEMQTVDEIFFGACGKLGTLFTIREAEIKKL